MLRKAVFAKSKGKEQLNEQEEKMMQSLLTYQVTCLLKLNKFTDAQQVLVETTVDISNRSGRGKDGLELQLLQLAVTFAAGEEADAITELYRLWAKEKSKDGAVAPRVAWILLTQLSS